MPDRIEIAPIASIRRRLAAGSGVRRQLADGGVLHIDRLLPFLCVYRRPPRRSDRDTDRLVTGQAAYLVASGSKQFAPVLTDLLRTIAQVAREEFGDFLVVEVWAGSEPDTAVDEPAVPEFRVHAAESDELATTLRALRDGLGPVRIGRKQADVRRPKRPSKHPPGLPPLSKGGGRWIGVEISPVWRRGEESFPLILNGLRRGFSRAVQRASYRFTRDHTAHRPKHYQALGRRAWVKAASQVDERLASTAEAFDFLLLMTPTNPDSAYESFRANHYRRAPRFLYRHLPVDPVLLKRSLYGARLEKVEDPTLAHLFRETQRELDLQLTALLERPSPNVLLLGRQIYGDVEPSLLKEAQEILAAIPPRAREIESTKTVGAAEFAASAAREIDAYRAVDPEFEASVSVRDDIAGLMVSRGRLLVGERLRIARARVSPLLHHEIGTHAVTFRNACVQPFRQLRYGLPGYEELQEGLAVLAEYLCGALSRPRLRLLAARVVAVHSLIDGARFDETFDVLHDRWSVPSQVAFGVATRVHRGGGIPKDAAYLRGLRAVVDYLGEGGDIEPLLVGKLAFDHLPLINELRRRGVVRAPALRPRFLDLPDTAIRLERLRPGLPLLELTCEVKK